MVPKHTPGEWVVWLALVAMVLVMLFETAY
jgi:hypothetical protein